MPLHATTELINYSARLAIDVYENGVLRYIGKVGTGWSGKKQKQMMAEFEPLITGTCPFDVEPDVDEPSQFRPRRLVRNPSGRNLYWFAK